MRAPPKAFRRLSQVLVLGRSSLATLAVNESLRRKDVPESQVTVRPGYGGPM